MRADDRAGSTSACAELLRRISIARCVGNQSDRGPYGRRELSTAVMPPSMRFIPSESAS
jgi:hypothetical protein